MADLNPFSLWRKLLALPNDSRPKTLAIAFIVSLVCAVLVSSASVLLAPMQEANRSAERQARLEAMIATMPGMEDLLAASGADGLDVVIVDLDTGLASDADPDTFDVAQADAESMTAIPTEADIAGLGSRPDLAPLYILREGDDLRLVILPVSAVGYQSTIRAYLALEGDLATVAGLTVTEQGETPGLGSRIQEPAWQALWPGKRLIGESGEIVLTVVRGAASADYEIDGITGATRSANAVGNAVRFWTGDYGFGPALDNLRAGRF